jgi:hypothetical protein
VALEELVREAEALLPGEPATEGQDPRWQAVIAIGEYIESEPEAVWSFIRRWGSHPQEDLRDLIATCLLEHLLERHFAAYFRRVKQQALAASRFADTFLRCWQLGQANEPGNAKQFEALRSQLLKGDSA